MGLSLHSPIFGGKLGLDCSGCCLARIESPCFRFSWLQLFGGNFAAGNVSGIRVGCRVQWLFLWSGAAGSVKVLTGRRWRLVAGCGRVSPASHSVDFLAPWLRAVLFRTLWFVFSFPPVEALTHSRWPTRGARVSFDLCWKRFVLV